MNLRTGSIPNVACLACIAGAYQASWYVVDAIVQALSPLEDPIKRGSDVVRQCYLDVRMNVYEVDWAWSGRSQDTEELGSRLWSMSALACNHNSRIAAVAGYPIG
jgi:hypothetical protein